MILLSGFHNKHRFVWYSKFTGMKNASETDNFPFYEHQDLLNDLLQFTANYLFEKIRKTAGLRIKDARTLVMEAFKHDKTMLVFNGYDKETELPYLFIEFYDNSIIREFIEDKQTVRFVIEMHRDGYYTDIREMKRHASLYRVGAKYKISYYDETSVGVIVPTVNNPTVMWDKDLKRKE